MRPRKQRLEFFNRPKLEVVEGKFEGGMQGRQLRMDLVVFLISPQSSNIGEDQSELVLKIVAIDTYIYKLSFSKAD